MELFRDLGFPSAPVLQESCDFTCKGRLADASVSNDQYIGFLVAAERAEYLLNLLFLAYKFADCFKVLEIFSPGRLHPFRGFCFRKLQQGIKKIGNAAFKTGFQMETGVGFFKMKDRKYQMMGLDSLRHCRSCCLTCLFKKFLKLSREFDRQFLFLGNPVQSVYVFI